METKTAKKYNHLLIVPHGNFPVPKTGLYYCTFMECYHHDNDKVQQDCCYAVASHLTLEEKDEIIKTQPQKPKNLLAQFTSDKKEAKEENVIGTWHEGKELGKVTLEDAKKILTPSYLCFKGSARWDIKDESEAMQEPSKTVYSKTNIHSFQFYNDDINVECEDDMLDHNIIHVDYGCFLRAHELGYYVPKLSEALVEWKDKYKTDFASLPKTEPKDAEHELSDKYKLLIYVVRSCLEDVKNELVITPGTTVDNFRTNKANDKQCKLIHEYVLNNFKYELSWNQMANGINLFLTKYLSSQVKPFDDRMREALKEEEKNKIAIEQYKQVPLMTVCQAAIIKFGEEIVNTEAGDLTMSTEADIQGSRYKIITITTIEELPSSPK